MTIIYIHPEIRTLPSQRIIMTETEDEFQQVMLEKDVVLALNEYATGFPTATKVETYLKEGNNYIFQDEWTPDRTREEAILAFYKSAQRSVQKAFFNEGVIK